MAKLEYSTNTSDVDEEIRARRGGVLRPLDRMLLHSPPVALGWNALLGAVRERTEISGALRELVILRIAVLNDCAYEWDAHLPVARREGLSEESIAALREDDAAALLSGSEASVCAFTDQVTMRVAVDAPIFDAVAEHFDERALVELAVTAAAYNMVSRFLVATGVGEELKESADV